MRVKTNFERDCLDINIDIQYIVSRDNSDELGCMITISLNIVNSENLPFVTVTGDIHVFFEFGSSEFFSEVTSRNLINIIFFGQEIPKLRVVSIV